MNPFKVLSRLWREKKRESKPTSRSTLRPVVESLEDRALPAVLNVTQPLDIVAPDGLLSLREAIDAVNTGIHPTTNEDLGNGPHEIVIPEAISQIALILGALSITTSDDLTISGSGADSLTISSENSSVFNLSGGGTTLVGMTLIGSTDDSGGAIVADSTSLIVNGVSFVDSTAIRKGGAIYANGTDVSISSSTFTGSTAELGGAIFVEGASGKLTINGSTFTESIADTGGAVYVRTILNKSQINSSSFRDNDANLDGGAIFSSETELDLNEVVISDNEAKRHGGGVAVSQGTLGLSTDSVVSGNQATEDGGGLYLSETEASLGGALTRNKALKSGGAIFVDGGTLSLSTSASLTENDAILDGGGILVRSGEVDITEATIENNTASRHGGGLRAQSGALVTIFDSDVRANTASEQGGGIDIENAEVTVKKGTRIDSNSANAGGGVHTLFSTFELEPDAYIENNTSQTDGGGLLALHSQRTTIQGSIQKNTATVNGGGIYSFDGVVEIDGANIVSNQALSGGGLFAETFRDGTDGPRALTIERSTFKENNAGSSTTTPIGGGGIHLINVGEVLIDHTTIVENQGGLGGGLLIENDEADVRIDRSTITDNIANDGGGVAIIGSLNADNLFSQVTISGNHAQASGGGIYIDSGDADLLHSTITRNTADSDNNATGSGGGIFVPTGSDVELDHTILAGNVDNSGTAPDLKGTVFAQHSLIGDVTGASLSLTNNIIGVDPRLRPLGDNGGPVPTHVPLLSSPVVNAGSESFTAPDSTLDDDQRGAGFARVFSGRIDIGATELQRIDSDLIVDNPNDEYDDDFSEGDLSLREAIRISNFNPGSDTITFAPSMQGSILSLTLGEMRITDDLTIKGDKDNRVTLDAKNQSRLLRIDNGFSSIIDVDLIGIDLTGGFSMKDGGAILSRENLRLDHVEVTASNSAQRGGAIASLDGSLTLIASTLHNNAAIEEGGGIYSDVTTTIDRSTISNNHSESQGGGIFADEALTVVNSTFSGNESQNEGGAAYIDKSATFSHSTIAFNSSEIGKSGGIFANAPVTLDHTIVAENSGGDIAELTNGSIDATFSLIGVDAGLYPLAHAGGPTKTHSLRLNSLALDGGDESITSSPATDQNGYNRIIGDVIDIGASEGYRGSIFWDGDAGDNLWSTAANWSTDRLPDEEDDVVIGELFKDEVITATGKVTVNTILSSAGLNIVSGHFQSFTIGDESSDLSTFNGLLRLEGNLSGAGTVTINDRMEWAYGDLTGDGSVVVGESGTLVIGLHPAFGRNLYRTLENHGTIIQQMSYTGRDSGRLINHESGVYDIVANVTLGGASGFVFDNQGTLRKSTTNGRANVYAKLNSSGTVKVQSGTLALSDGNSSGNFEVAPEQTLRFEGGAHTITLGDNDRIFGGGILENHNATVTVNGTGSIDIDEVRLTSNGQLDFDLPISVPRMTLIGYGNVGGSGTITVTEQLDWFRSGLNGSGKLVIPVEALATLRNSDPRGDILFSRDIDNFGTMTLEQGPYRAHSGATLVNHGTFNIASDTRFGGNVADLFDNRGTIQKTAGNGVANLHIPLNNTGTVQVDVGTLSIGSGISEGDFLLADDTTLQIAGTHTIDLAEGEVLGGGHGKLQIITSGRPTIQGDGEVTLDEIEVGGGTLVLDVSTPVFVSRLRLIDGGTFDGSSDVTVTESADWFNQVVKGEGELIVGEDATMTIMTTNVRDGMWFAREIINQGTVDYQLGSVEAREGASIVNHGLFDLTGNISLLRRSTTPLFTNQGTLRKSGGGGTAKVDFEIQSNGNIEASDGLLHFSLPVTQTKGATILDGGDLRVDQGFSLDGGQLVGSGTVTGGITQTAGIIKPGNGLGILTVDGPYTATGGELEIEVADRPQSLGVSHDQLIVTKDASVAGLAVVREEDFYPILGDRYIVVKADSVTGPTSTNADDVGMTVEQNPTSLVLEVIREINRPPEANAGGPYFGDVGAPLSFDASASTDPNQSSESLVYEWDLDYDGLTFDIDAIGRQFTRTFVDQIPARSIAVCVTDVEGASDLAITTLQVGRDDLFVLADSNEVRVEDFATGFEILSVSDSSVLDLLPVIDANGTLIFTPASLDSTGTATITMALTDNGIPKTSTIQTFEITVIPPVVTILIDEDDGGLGRGEGESLREILTVANATPGETTITFASDLNGDMELSNGTLAIDDDVEIEGLGANLLNVGFLDDPVLHISQNANATISGVTIRNGYQGIASYGDLTLIDSVVAHNGSESAPFRYFGGGIYHQGRALLIQGSTIHNNKGRHGGGINLQSNGMMTVINTTISNNESELEGGGIFSFGDAVLINVTIADNQANALGSGDEGGGGIYHDLGTFTLHNSIVANNTIGSELGSEEIFGTFDPESASNLIGTSFGAEDDGDLTEEKGNLFRSVKIGLADLANNGGRAPTRALLPLSPALNAGDNALAVNLENDQRGDGFSRISGRTIDIGAYEAQAPFVVTPFDNQTIDEDAPPLLIGDVSLSFDDVEGDELTFSVTNSNDELVSASLDGAQLSITPVADQFSRDADAVATITVRATDAHGLFAESSFDVLVHPVNDAPTFTGEDLYVLGDSNEVHIEHWATDIAAGPDNERNQALSFRALDVSDSSLFDDAPTIDADGTLTFTPASVETAGMATITVGLKDNGGTDRGGIDTTIKTFEIHVFPPVVTTLVDENDGRLGQGESSLREILSVANATPGETTITFDPTLTGEMQLIGSSLVIEDDVNIEGLGADTISIRGRNGIRVFDVRPEVTVSITDVTITGGRIATGGAGIRNAGTLTLDQVAITDNEATLVANGGGITNLSTGDLTILNSAISGSTAAGDGGGLFNLGALRITSSLLNGNGAGEDGGGIANHGVLVLVNSTISGNHADNDGGGIANGLSGDAILTNVSIVLNDADFDGDFSGEGEGIATANQNFTLHNTLVLQNGHATEREIKGTVDSSSSHNLIDSHPNRLDTGGLTETNGNLYYSRLDLEQQRLTELVDNGGPTRTHALLGNNPALDAGSNERATEAGLSFDQRGMNRFSDGGSGEAIVDIGAYEAVAVDRTFFVTTDLDEKDNELGQGDGDSLREVIQAANDNVGTDTIRFLLAQESAIDVAPGLPTIYDDLFIDGPGADQLDVVSQNGNAIIFSIDFIADVSISGLTIRDGGTGIQNLGELTVVETEIASNGNLSFSPPRGGGIGHFGSSLTMIGSTIHGNKGKSGGGIFVGAPSTQVTIVNSTISNNQATEDGGGLRLSGAATLINVTLVGNRADADGNGHGKGGGIFANSSPGRAKLHNSIIVDNYVGTGTVGSEISGRLDSESSNNLIGTLPFFSDDHGDLKTNNGNIFRALGFGLGELADNGGPTPTHALLPSSPALNRGDNELIDDEFLWDQRGLGFSRILGGTIDIGAFEANVPITLTPPVAPTINEDDSAFATLNPRPQSLDSTGGFQFVVERLNRLRESSTPGLARSEAPLSNVADGPRRSEEPSTDLLLTKMFLEGGRAENESEELDEWHDGFWELFSDLDSENQPSSEEEDPDESKPAPNKEGQGEQSDSMSNGEEAQGDRSDQDAADFMTSSGTDKAVESLRKIAQED